MQDQGLGLELLHRGGAGGVWPCLGFVFHRGGAGDVRLCSRGIFFSGLACSGGIFFSGSAASYLKVRKKSFLAMSTDIASTSSMVEGLALKFEEDLVFKSP